MSIFKKGVQVKIISGKDKGKTGEILEINRVLNRVTPIDFEAEFISTKKLIKK